MTASEYQCARCGGIFEKGWSDEEACAEATGQFTDAELQDTAIVCDDCYKKIMGLPC